MKYWGRAGKKGRRKMKAKRILAMLMAGALLLERRPDAEARERRAALLAVRTARQPAAQRTTPITAVNPTQS